MLAGCGNKGRPVFEESEGAKSLVGVVRDSIKVELKNAYGTPTELVAWSVLPVDYGRVHARVESAMDGLVRMNAATPVNELIGGLVTIGGKELGAVQQLTGEHEFVLNGSSVQIGEGALVEGGKLVHGRMLYHRHCMHCHGVSGDGNGSTAKYFAVKPRDYRNGVFKFTSTVATARATRDDLQRIIRLGVPGTYMPSFMLLKQSEVVAITEYIRWLSMRGETERKLVVEYRSDFLGGADESKKAAEFKTLGNDHVSAATAKIVEELSSDWREADEGSDQVIIPKSNRSPATKESIERGRAIFLGAKAKCFSCHGEQGRGDGVSTESYNEIDGKPGQLSSEPGLYDIWGNITRPRDLTSGIYRGGRRPLDIYRRVFAGIKGTKMQGFGGTLSDEEIWDVTNFVLDLPFKK